MFPGNINCASNEVRLLLYFFSKRSFSKLLSHINKLNLFFRFTYIDTKYIKIHKGYIKIYSEKQRTNQNFSSLEITNFLVFLIFKIT